MLYRNIELNHCDGITEIRMNRPEKRNPLSFEMIAELTEAFNEVKQSETLGIVLSGAGPSFCSGHDYADMVPRDLQGMRELMHACAEMMQLIHNVPQPVIASVQGWAVGGGCQLALTCDMVVAAEDAKFRTPGGAGGWFCFTPMVAVARAVGRKRALEMLMVGDPITAVQASEWGMVNRVVPNEALADETWDLMHRATRGSRLMKGMGKHAYYTQIDLDEAKAYEYASEIMAATGTMPDARERMEAFVAKRATVG